MLIFDTLINGMKILKLVFLVLVLPLVGFSAHKFYVSVTNIDYSDEDDALQITTRVFINDFEELLKLRYDIDVALATYDESNVADEYTEKYLKTKFVVEIDGELRAFDFLGKEYDRDIMICYLEIKDVEISKVKTISVQNDLLNDLFEEQKNVVHFNIQGKRKSLVLIKQNNKGMLNL